ncbi:type II toxin-antitoxin system VapC family toxin [Bradyrhizobium sp. 138]|uniref:type II toxin-antitoxin system VapC family toxin n=1 Tax=Bradyrhizobium sp. 138 TaxID=2782615 RepID=UPI001FFB54BE|nr:type II toxin-antitoxin system VapC family toxin [Bradyrhizobium sp. 138]MCK1732407.1 type II toxin-antitoxin system VapC family toxin [Bradyrhizobium sp. 138]
MIVLDTNVISEFMRPAPSAAVERWMSAVPAASIFISSITEAELRYGLALLPASRRQRQLIAQAEAMLAEDFAGRILPFDSSAAAAYARIAAARRLAGRPISQSDAQIAAIAVSRGASLATRNVGDFVDCGINVIDPWRKGAR